MDHMVAANNARDTVTAASRLYEAIDTLDAITKRARH